MQGRFWQIDSSGYILNDARADYLQPPFDAAVDEAVQALVDHIGPDLDSIYVTGSVARGLAIPGESDLNIFAVTTSTVDPELVLQEWIEAAEVEIAARHDCLRAVQMELWPYYYVFTDPARFSIGGFILKTHSLCVWGSDLAASLPDYGLAPGIANDDLVQLRPDIEDAIADIQADSSSDNLRDWCRRASKAVLHAGFGLVQTAEGAHTRDIDLCAATFAKHYPQYHQPIEQVLVNARQPITQSDALRRYLDSLDWILRLADTWLDQHNPDRDLALPVDDVEALE